MSRHVSAAGTRFRLLNCGMSLLQGDVLPKSLSKHALRQRIYSCSLDFFCAEKMYPVRGLPLCKQFCSVAEPKLFIFGSGSTFVHNIGSSYNHIYCHLKLFYNSTLWQKSRRILCYTVAWSAAGKKWYTTELSEVKNPCYSWLFNWTSDNYQL